MARETKYTEKRTLWENLVTPGQWARGQGAAADHETCGWQFSDPERGGGGKKPPGNNKV